MKTENRDNTYVFNNFVRMSKQKLTLALEPDLIAFGKAYALERGTSITEVFERYLTVLRSAAEPSGLDPLVEAVREAASLREPVTLDELHAIREEGLRNQMLRYETGA
jgi:hypothetical protein